MDMKINQDVVNKNIKVTENCNIRNEHSVFKQCKIEIIGGVSDPIFVNCYFYDCTIVFNSGECFVNCIFETTNKDIEIGEPFKDFSDWGIKHGENDVKGSYDFTVEYNNELPFK